MLLASLNGRLGQLAVGALERCHLALELTLLKSP